MPELPEVETVVRDLQKKVVGRRILHAWCDAPSILRNRTFVRFSHEVRGARIEKVLRRGKNILLYLALGKKQKLLLVHQKMTGHLLVGKWMIPKKGSIRRPQSLSRNALQEKVNQYIHLILILDDDRMLALSDARKFAKVLIGDVSEIEAMPDLVRLGPEPLETISEKEFTTRLLRKKGRMKSVLLNQEFVAGIGNIYADEILWQTGLHPLRNAKHLRDDERQQVFRTMQKVLKKAISFRGTSMRDFRDTEGKKGGYERELLVYGRHGKPCARCGATIERIVVGGRSAHLCPQCQPRSFYKTKKSKA